MLLPPHRIGLEGKVAKVRHLPGRIEPEMMDVVARGDRLDLGEQRILRPARQHEMASTQARRTVSWAKDIRTWKAIRVFSGNVSTGPKLSSIAWKAS